MQTQNLTLAQFADLLSLETQRGIVNGGEIIQMIIDGKLPKIIHDIRGAVRLTVEREGEGLAVTEYLTKLAEERIGEIY
jgi:hypothetical protein